MNPYIDGESQSDDSSKVKFWAIRVIDGEPIHASKATKEDGPFYCPKSHEDLVVRKCVEKVSHFAYKTRLSPTGSKESSLHFDCKTEICEALQKAFPEGDWQVERSLLADSEKDFAALRPDISGRFGEAQLPVVIEVQASFLSIKKIITRTTEHTKRNAAILWILPLEEELGEKLFRPRLFEKFLHSMYYGRVYYWQRGNGTLLQPVHYNNAEKYIDEKGWYESKDDYRTAGGYYRPYKHSKKPLLGESIDILADFKSELRLPFKVKANQKKDVPECQIFKDNLQVWWSDKPTRYKSVLVKSKNGDGYIYELIEEKDDKPSKVLGNNNI